MFSSCTTKTHLARVFSLVFLVFFFVAVFATPTLAQTAKYTPLVNVPGLNTSGATSLPDYINKIYILLISIGALFGVVKIAIAGVKYATTEVVTGKSSAKDDIKGVLMGLAILLLPYIVLYTINPELTKLNVLENATKVQLNQSSRGTGAGGIDTGEGRTSEQLADEAIRNTNVTIQTERYSLTPIFDPVCPSCYNIVDYDDSGARAQCSARSGTFTIISASVGECTYGDASYGNDGNQGMPQ